VLPELHISYLRSGCAIASLVSNMTVMRSKGRGIPPLGMGPMADGGGGTAAVGALAEKEG